MIKQIHHLNCGSMCPFCERLMNGTTGSWTKPGNFVCPCLLIEMDKGLVLVDTGMGTRDIQNPRGRLGSMQPLLFKPKLLSEETAVEQVRALGYDPKDVKHIIPTHLDVDHAGGLADFPDATVWRYRPDHSAC